MTITGKVPANLGDLLSRAGGGNRTVLVDLGGSDSPLEFTASEFQQRVYAFARGLMGRGIERGDRVGLLSGNRWEMLVAYLGTMAMGAVVVPINHKLTRETIGHVVMDANVQLMFFDDRRRSLLPQNVQAIGFDEPGIDGLEAFLDPGSLAVFEPGEQDLAEILHTSGSSGQPKGVPLTHRGQLWALSKYLEPIGDDASSGASLIAAPFYHMNGLFFASVCLLNATTIILQARFSAAQYIDAVSRYQCSQLSGVPAMFAMVADLDADLRRLELHCVKRIKIGSAPFSEALLSRLEAIFPSAEITNGYGSTEAGPAIFGPHPQGKARPRLALGYPLEDVQWRLMGGMSADEGVLELKTPALASAYLNRPEADSERFKNGWFNTNDIMRCDKDGFMYFVSRADDMFVCGGENIFPTDIEALLNRHPAVQESLVVGAPDDIKGRVPVAFVVPIRNARPNEQEIKTFCLSNGPAYAHPRRVLFKRALPLGGTHKIDRRSLEFEAETLMTAAGRASSQ